MVFRDAALPWALRRSFGLGESRGRSGSTLVERQCLALGWVYHFSRRYDEAIEQYRKTLEIDPGFLLAYHFLAMSYEQKGMYEDAIAACQHAAKLPGGIAVLTGGLVHTYAKAGRLDKAGENSWRSCSGAARLLMCPPTIWRSSTRA